MSTKQEVLALLQSSNDSLSGEEIASKLGVSRNSVWKAVNLLKQEGYEIESVTNRGYKLISTGDALTSASIMQYIPKKYNMLKIDVRDEVTSTNTVLKAIAEQGEKEGYVLISQEQTGGKGRLGRSFYSPFGSGLYMSILLRPKFSAENSLFITTAAAVATANAVREITGADAKIKWVNDIYIGYEKICGILTEASINFETNGLEYAVLGIGVNIKEPEGGFGELKGIATAIYKAEPPKGTRARLAAGILAKFMEFYNSLEEKAFMEEYKSLSFLTGIEIEYLLADKTESGVVLGIDDDAKLIVKLHSGEIKKYYAGEISIKKGYKEKKK